MFWLAYRGTNTGWDGSLVAGIDTDRPLPIPSPAVAATTIACYLPVLGVG